ncbi:retrovirus-related pol polyprotein from transposon TNT 1-94 [Tanacetum coccineum]
MTIIGTKWVFKNKLDGNGIVSRNKAWLVAQGYNQQEGINYDETYAPVARLESIRILLAYFCALDFKVFQMDVKSAFLNGFINEEVYVAQPLGFINFEKLDHVYKLKKALYGLKQAPKACVYLCARFQEAPKSSHINALKDDYVDQKSSRERTYLNQKGVSPIPEELHMDDDTTADEQAYSSSGEDVGRDHIPTINLRQTSALKSTYTPPPENSLLAQIGDMATFMNWYCKKQGISELTQMDLEGPAYEIVKVFHPDVVHLQFQMEECHKLLTDQVDDTILRYNVSKPLPLGGDPGHVTIQPDFFFNKDLEYLRYGRKLGRPALSISKMKAAYYPDVGLEKIVPD